MCRKTWTPSAWEESKGKSKYKGRLTEMANVRGVNRVAPPTERLSKNDLNLPPPCLWPLRPHVNLSIHWTCYRNPLLHQSDTEPLSEKVTGPENYSTCPLAPVKAMVFRGRWAPLGTASILPERTGDTLQQDSFCLVCAGSGLGPQHHKDKIYQ